MVWNRRLRDFTDYYGFISRVCRPYRAHTKGKVETGIRYLKGNFLLRLDASAMSPEELGSAISVPGHAEAVRALARARGRNGVGEHRPGPPHRQPGGRLSTRLVT